MRGRRPEVRSLLAETRRASTLAAASTIHVSSLGNLRGVANMLPAYHLLTLLSPSAGDDSTLQELTPVRRLHLAFHDVMEDRPDFIAPNHETVLAILDFGRHWMHDVPMLIHCWAGISRSSAAAYMLACDDNPGLESDIADELRRRAPFATPNRLMVALADDMLGRQGRMVDAIDRIGRGADAFEGTPYQLPLKYVDRRS